VLRRDPLALPEPLIRRVYSYAAYRVGAGPDAEDVTSETFEHAVRYAHSYDARKGEPIAWLLGIARHCADRHLGSRLPGTGMDVDLVAAGELESAAIRRIEVRAAVAELGARDRDLIALRYGADLTAREIAELLELKTNAVEVALHRALARLRALLEEEPEAASSAL
jgi:RNA polymerase sigma-70 factor (ECF subfamily)